MRTDDRYVVRYRYADPKTVTRTAVGGCKPRFLGPCRPVEPVDIDRAIIDSIDVVTVRTGQGNIAGDGYALPEDVAVSAIIRGKLGLLDPGRPVEAVDVSSALVGICARVVEGRPDNECIAGNRDARAEYVVRQTVRGSNYGGFQVLAAGEGVVAGAAVDERALRTADRNRVVAGAAGDAFGVGDGDHVAAVGQIQRVVAEAEVDGGRGRRRVQVDRVFAETAEHGLGVGDRHRVVAGAEGQRVAGAAVQIDGDANLVGAEIEGVVAGAAGEHGRAEGLGLGVEALGEDAVGVSVLADRLPGDDKAAVLEGRCRRCVLGAGVSVLIWNSDPTGLPAPSKRWPKTPVVSPSWSAEFQTATKPPSPSATTEGVAWLPAVNVLSWNSPPSALPAASKMRPKTPKALPSAPLSSSQVTTKPPPSSAVTDGLDWLRPVVVLTTNSDPPTRVPAASKTLAKMPWPLPSSWPAS